MLVHVRTARKAAVDRDSDVWQRRVPDDRRPAHTELLLHGAHRVDVDRRRRDLAHGLDEAICADPVVEVTAEDDLLVQLLELLGVTHRVADLDELSHPLDREADVDIEIVRGQLLRLRMHRMDGHDDALERLAAVHDDALRRRGVRMYAADDGEAQVPAIVDVPDHEADLVGVRREDEARCLRRITGGAAKADDVAEPVGRDLVARRSEVAGDEVLHVVLEARDAVRVADLLKQLDVDGRALRSRFRIGKKILAAVWNVQSLRRKLRRVVRRDQMIPVVQVVVQLPTGARGVALLDGLDDPLVLCEYLAQVFWGLNPAEPHQAREAADLLEQPSDDREVGSARDRDVELLVQLEELLFVAGVDRPLLAEQGQVQQVDLVVGQRGDGGVDRDLLERLANAEDLVPVLHRERADDELLARADLEQPFCSKQLERLTQRRLRDAELRRDACLRDHLCQPACRREGSHSGHARTPAR